MGIDNLVAFEERIRDSIVGNDIRKLYQDIKSSAIVEDHKLVIRNNMLESLVGKTLTASAVKELAMQFGRLVAFEQLIKDNEVIVRDRQAVVGTIHVEDFKPTAADYLDDVSSKQLRDSRYITLTRKEIEDFWVCCADSKGYDVPYAFCMSREVYEKYYHRKFRHLIKEDYICIWECHEDTYFHATTADRVEIILNSGYINPMGDATLTVGKAVYTFPQGSGRVFNTKKDLRVISFKAKAPHIHIVDAVDSNCVIGEANFLESIRLPGAYQGILSMDEAQALKESSWDANVGLRHYYGVKDEEFTEDMASVTVKELPEFVNKFIVDYSAWE